MKMKMVFHHIRPVILIIMLLTLFFSHPVKGISNISVPTNDMTEESIEAFENEVYSAFESFSEVTKMINQSDSITEEQLSEYFPEIKIETQKEPFIWINLNSGNKVWILPSFYWGCFFGPVGVLVAGIVSKWENDYLTDSLAGAIVNCNVIVDVAIITYFGIILYGFLMLLQENPPDLSGCTNVW